VSLPGFEHSECAEDRILGQHYTLKRIDYGVQVLGDGLENIRIEKVGAGYSTHAVRCPSLNTGESEERSEREARGKRGTREIKDDVR